MEGTVRPYAGANGAFRLMINFADCLKMTQYVYGFANVSLGDIAKVERGKRITKSETKDSGKYPVFFR